MLFHALEYGLGEDEEHVLSRPFEMLLDRMTSADPECCSDEDEEMSSDDDSGEEDCHDEGIEKDSGEDDPGGGDGGAGGKPPAHRAGLTLAKVLEVRAPPSPFAAGKFAQRSRRNAFWRRRQLGELLCSSDVRSSSRTAAHPLTISPLTERGRLAGLPAVSRRETHGGPLIES